MARLSIINRENRRIKTCQQYAEKRRQIKSQIKELQKDSEENYDALQQAYKMLRKLPRNASPVRLRNRCRITGRARGVYSKVKLARSMFRIHAMQGEIPGIVKSSW